MATNYPTSVDDFATTSPANLGDDDSTGRTHPERHNDMESAMEAVQAFVLAQTLNAQTGTTYTPVAGDVGKLVTLSNTGAITVTLPQDSALTFPVGQRVDFLVINTGMATFSAGSGATVNATPSAVSRAQWSAVSAIKRAADTWVVVGDLA